MRSTLLGLVAMFAVGLATQIDPSICKSPGFVCPTCTQLAACILYEDTYTIEHIQYCNTDEKCSRDGCTCEKVPECEYHGLDFVCKSIGIFPDQSFCDRYHFCVPDNGKITEFSAACDIGYGYNPTTTFCSDVVDKNFCEFSPVPLCEEPGQTGALSNPSLYYVCSEYSESDRTLYPFLFACPHGTYFDNFICTESPSMPTTTPKNDSKCKHYSMVLYYLMCSLLLLV